MVIEVDGDDERKALELMRDVLRGLRDNSVLTVMREGLTLKTWCNGSRSGYVRLNNRIPAWEARPLPRV